MMAAAPAAGGGGRAAERRPNRPSSTSSLEPGFDAAKKINIIKVVREITGLGR